MCEEKAKREQQAPGFAYRRQAPPQLPPFENEPHTDFSNPQNVQTFQAALDRVRAHLGEKHPVVVGGLEVWTEATFDSVNPAHPEQVVGVFGRADPALVDKAIQYAAEAFEKWRKVPAAERADYLFRAAEKIRERKHEFSAWMVFEVGKSWSEADADTAEAIDFLEYYGRQMIELARIPQPFQAPGECDEIRYIPLGVGAVIPPWNFPLAIMGGMSSGSIVAGNTIVLKPASTAPRIAWEFFQVMRQVGLPDGVFNYLTGPGGSVGDALVEHPHTRFIAFTGSRSVGVGIYERAARTPPGQKWLKRAILEMGGKGAVVVDETADLDDAALGIVVSAFGYQGQKCSAGSRAILVDEIYDQLLDKVVQKTQEIAVIGDPVDPHTYIGPIVDENQYRKILQYIEIGRGEGRLILGGRPVDRDGWYIEPTIFADVSPRARIAQEEIFGPVLTVIRAEDYVDAIRIANDTEYGLTGSFYTGKDDRIAYASDEFHVGNLYINRKSTGALVGPHPFGGFNMSGTNSKAGGPDYMREFSQAKAIAEQVRGA